MGELKLGNSGALDPETAKQVGKLAGVDALVTGTITDLQSYVAINCRMIDVQTGAVFAAAQTRIVKDDDLRKIMGAAMPSTTGGVDQPTTSTSPPATTPSANTGRQKVASTGVAFELGSCRRRARAGRS